MTCIQDFLKGIKLYEREESLKHNHTSNLNKIDGDKKNPPILTQIFIKSSTTLNSKETSIQ